VILLAAVLIFFARVLLARTFVIPWDFRSFHLPLAMAVFDAMKGTGSVLWDTTTYCGRPLFADPQAQIFYPPTDLAIFISTFFGASRLAYILEWELALHVFAAGAFTYLMLRRMGISRAAALCGGLVFELSGFIASQTQHFGAVAGAAWIPLMWAAVWQQRREFTGVWFGVLTLSSAMAILAGFTPITGTAIASAIIFSGILVFSGEARATGPLIVLAGVLAAIGLSAIMLLPAVQLTLLSVAQYRSDWVDGTGFPFSILKSLILPPSRQTISDLLYCGVGGLSLALIALFNKSSRRLALPVAGLTLLSGIWMFGNGTIYGRALWRAAPDLLKGSLYPYYGMAPFCLGLAVLAGIGLNGIRRFSTAGKYAVALLVAVDLIVVGSGRPMNASEVRKDPGITRDQIGGSTAALMSLRKLTTGEPPARTDTHAGLESFSTTAPLTQIPTANGYNPLALERLIRVRLSFAKGDRWGAWYEVEDLTSPVIDLLNVRYVLSNKPIANPGTAPAKLVLRAALPGFLVYENHNVLPRFFIVRKIRLVHTAEEAFSFVHRPDFPPSTLAIVEEPSSDKTTQLRPLQLNSNLIEPPDESQEQTKVLSYTPREISLSVRTPAPGFLVTSEAQYPGWHAWIDGAEVPVFMTNGAFRGLFVPAGEHAVHLVFAPVIQYFGAGITLLSLCATCAMFRIPRPASGASFAVQ
jgi:hypothetical protein